jgi:uncharacterized phage-like protein YoqJ
MITNNTDIHLAVTGVRASKLFGPKYTDEVYAGRKVKLILMAMVKFLELNPRIRKVYIGMSSGIDLLFGIAIYKYKRKYGYNSIELVCCVPGIKQTKGFTQEEKIQYNFILNRVANKVEKLSAEECDPDLYRDRNKFMVRNTHMTASFWDLDKRHSDTFKTMSFTKQQDKPVYLFDSQNMRENGVWWNPPAHDSNIIINPIWKIEEPSEGELLAAGYASDM